MVCIKNFVWESPFKNSLLVQSLKMTMTEASFYAKHHSNDHSSVPQSKLLRVI